MKLRYRKQVRRLQWRRMIRLLFVVFKYEIHVNLRGMEGYK